MDDRVADESSPPRHTLNILR